MPSDDTNTKLWTNLPAEQFEYFFRKIFAGDRGIKQQLINTFFARLYAECRRRGIPGEWDTENGKLIVKIAENVTFPYDQQPRTRKSSRVRRASGSPPKSQAQPAFGRDDAGPAHRVSQEDPDAGNVSPNTDS